MIASSSFPSKCVATAVQTCDHAQGGDLKCWSWFCLFVLLFVLFVLGCSSSLSPRWFKVLTAIGIPIGILIVAQVPGLIGFTWIRFSCHRVRLPDHVVKSIGLGPQLHQLLPPFVCSFVVFVCFVVVGLWLSCFVCT